MKTIITLSLCILLSSCQSRTPIQERWLQASDSAFPLEPGELIAENFKLKTLKGIRPNKPLHVFTEENGSDALTQARKAHAKGLSVVYISSPCQFDEDAFCKKPGWLEASMENNHKRAHESAIYTIKRSYRIKEVVWNQGAR